MRFLISLLALLLGAAAPDTATSTLAPDTDVRWVPFTLTPANQILFRATLDGQPVNALLDTGASPSMLTLAYAQRTGRAVGRRGQAAAIGGAVANGWTAVRGIAFGGLTSIGGGLNVVALPATATGNGGTIDLLVGRDLLDRYALDIDYANHRFRLLPSGRLPFAGTRLPLRIGSSPATYLTEIGIAGRRLRPVVVDTGDGTALTLSRDAWRNLPLAPPPAMTTQLAYGVGGAVVADIATVPVVTLGERQAAAVPAWIERSGGFSDTARVAGRIGSGLLQQYRVLLDPQAGLMVLGNGGMASETPRSTSGLQLALTGTALRVLHVMRGGPAAATGWQVGDRICAVDGTKVADDPQATSGYGWLFGIPGTPVTLTMCDGTARLLVLRRFY